MIKERYCSYEVARLLKEKGFREWCRYCYGTAVRHNGADIDEDEEFELKSEGKANEIEYIKGGILHNLYYDNNDKSFGKDVCAAPTHQMACDWLQETHNLFLKVGFGNDLKGEFLYMVDIYDMSDSTVYIRYEPIVRADDYLENNPKTVGDAIEAALKYALKNLVKI